MRDRRYRFSQEERNAILAGLRCLQDMKNGKDPQWIEIYEIFTNDYKDVPLTMEEIDRLCERINR